MFDCQRIFIGFSSFSFPMQARPILLLYPFMHSFVRSFAHLRTYIVGGFNYFIPSTCIQTALFDVPHPPWKIRVFSSQNVFFWARPPASWLSMRHPKTKGCSTHEGFCYRLDMVGLPEAKKTDRLSAGYSCDCQVFFCWDVRLVLEMKFITFINGWDVLHFLKSQVPLLDSVWPIQTTNTRWFLIIVNHC